MKDGYILKELSLEEQKELETALIKPMLMVSAIDSMDPHSLEYKEKFLYSYNLAKLIQIEIE